MQPQTVLQLSEMGLSMRTQHSEAVRAIPLEQETKKLHFGGKNVMAFAFIKGVSFLLEGDKI